VAGSHGESSKMSSLTEVETLPGMAAERDGEDPWHEHGHAATKNSELARSAAEELELCIGKHREELHGLLRSFLDRGIMQKQTHSLIQEEELHEPFLPLATRSSRLEPVVPRASVKSLSAAVMAKWTFSEDDRQEGGGTSSFKNSLADHRAMEEQQNVWLRIIRNPWFDRVGALLIISSSILTGVEVEYAAANMTDSLPVVFQILQAVFLHCVRSRTGDTSKCVTIGAQVLQRH